MAACGGSGTVTTHATPVSAGATVPAPAPTVPGALADLAEETIAVGETALRVAVAASGSERRRGLMGVSELGPLDGMLFVFDEDTASGFWMKDTLLRLDIAFFAGDGSVVDSFVMVPCQFDPCPVYTPAASYRYALEMPAGSMPLLDGDVRLMLDF